MDRLPKVCPETYQELWDNCTEHPKNDDSRVPVLKFKGQNKALVSFKQRSTIQQMTEFKEQWEWKERLLALVTTHYPWRCSALCKHRLESTLRICIHSVAYESTSKKLAICPSHPLQHPDLLVDPTLHIEQVPDILSEPLVVHTSQRCFNTQHQSFHFAYEPPGVTVGNRPMRLGSRRGQNAGDISEK